MNKSTKSLKKTSSKSTESGNHNYNKQQYTQESIRNVLKRAVNEAGVRKHVTSHTLRHSYATHMLEDGIDLRYIQALLGHAKPETTQIYTHVTRKELVKIKSPFDTLMEDVED